MIWLTGCGGATIVPGAIAMNGFGAAGTVPGGSGAATIGAPAMNGLPGGAAEAATAEPRGDVRELVS